MRFADRLLAALSLTVVATVVSPAAAQVLYMQDFQVDDTANWTVNNGPSDEAHDFFFDYSTLGIPQAPNSAAGPTRGMKLQANLFNAVFSGMSVSPNGQSFTGDYSMKFDWWHNFLGPLGPGGTGSTMLTTFGIGTTGTVANWPSVADGTYFAITGDGNSSADFRVYSPERPVSHQLPANTDLDMNPATIEIDSEGTPIDSHATYLGGTRQNTGAAYVTAFPGGASAPAAQVAIDPTAQAGTTNPGAAGFVWNQMEIRKIGNVVRLFANGVEIMNYDGTLALVPNAGTNIMFGQSDINATTNQVNTNYPTLQFSLIDNIKVEAFTATTEDADFDNDNDVDGNDFLIWQRGLGQTPADLADGDANDDNVVNAADLDIWKDQFGAAPPVAAVPEPATWVLGALAVVLAIVAALPRRQAAPVRVKTRR
jgi:hypothetical protein